MCSYPTRDGPAHLCPADPATGKGKCPFIPAADTCQPDGAFNFLTHVIEHGHITADVHATGRRIWNGTIRS